jgi:hypothetical protein
MPGYGLEADSKPEMTCAVDKVLTKSYCAHSSVRLIIGSQELQVLKVDSRYRATVDTVHPQH